MTDHLATPATPPINIGTTYAFVDRRLGDGRLLIRYQVVAICPNGNIFSRPQGEIPSAPAISWTVQELTRQADAGAVVIFGDARAAAGGARLPQEGQS